VVITQTSFVFNSNSETDSRQIEHMFLVLLLVIV
jgi:hypothetical protein